MTNSNSFIISVYNSRKNLLEILNERGFNIEKYSDFGITEIGILMENNQLDMLLENETTKKKIYVKYYVSKVIKPQNIYDIVEDLFHLESILEKKDESGLKSVKINESKNEDILEIEELPSEEQDKSKEISLLKLSTTPINETISETIKEESDSKGSIQKKTIKINQQ